MANFFNNNKALYYGIFIFVAFVALFVLVFLLFIRQDGTSLNVNSNFSRNQQQLQPQTFQANNSSSAPIIRNHNLSSDITTYNQIQTKRSSANISVVEAIHVYEIPYELMHDPLFSEKLNKYINSEVFVYRSGSSLSTNQHQNSFKTYTYRFEKWNTSLSNMFTANGILFSAQNQGFFNSDEVNTRFFIKLSNAALNSSFFASFCLFITNSAIDFKIRRTSVQIQGTPILVTTENRPGGQYVADWEGETIFGPETDIILCEK
jgi:hypothetical protein